MTKESHKEIPLDERVLETFPNERKLWYEDPKEEEERLSALKEEQRLKVKAYIELFLSFLTPKQRKLIEMYYFKEMSEKEIAEELKISKAAVHRQLQNALRSLRLKCNKEILENKEKKSESSD